MDYPLAHDDSGLPIQVPANAAGWLVRKHGGGRGRPAAVYDGDGRPLLVPLEATAGDLKTHGCKPGTYRLDAVDASRRPLEAVAYTEVGLDVANGELADDLTPNGSDAAVAALARAVEAMQRVQAERERAQAERDRVQAEMISRLVDRLAPPPKPEAPRNLRDALGEYGDVQKLIRKLAPEPDESEDPSDTVSDIADVVRQVVSVAMLYVQQKLGFGLGGAGTETPVGAQAAAETRPHGESEASPEPGDPPASGENHAQTEAAKTTAKAS